jgi:hypothetical protein
MKPESRRGRGADPAAKARRGSTATRWARLGCACALVLVVLSLIPRLRQLDAPLLDRHGFRQTQTAITVWTFVEEGIRPFDYETPVFGPPWRVPFEFPTFQMTAALLAKLGVDNIDVACRLANLLFFYLSALLLFLLCRIHFDRLAPSLCVLLVYLWAPLNVFWSRTAMIDYASVALALGYLYFFIRWLAASPLLLRGLLWTASFGTLAYLTKPTTLPTVLVPLGVVLLNHYRPDSRARSASRLGRRSARPGQVALIGIAILGPVLAAYLWTAYTGAILHQQEFTSDTARLGRHLPWLLGPWEWRLHAQNWWLILARIRSEFLPGPLVILAPTGLLVAGVSSIRERSFVFGFLAGAGLTVLTFFRLYVVHEYYLMGVAPAVCLVTGIGLYGLVVIVPRHNVWLAAPVIGLLGLGIQPLRASLQFPEMTPAGQGVVQLGAELRELTHPDEYVIVTDADWNPAILYYARRKGFMLRTQFDVTQVSQFLRKHNFTTIVGTRWHSELLANWRHARQIRTVGKFHVFRVSDDPGT